MNNMSNEKNTSSGDTDYIRRLDVGLTDFEIVMCDGDYKEALIMLLDKIEKAPSVIPKPKMGHWIGHREHCENLGVVPSGLGAYEWCSNCDCGIDVKEWHRTNYNYCPNCGAKMIERIN